MSPYTFASMPLTPKVFAEVTMELVEPNAVVHRRDLIEMVSTHHEAHGGLPTRSDMTTVAKKALHALQEAGRAQGGDVPGYWRFPVGTKPSDPDVTIQVGEGAETVYVYYFPAYRDQAAYLGRDDWPMKVGMTVGEHALRIRDQVGTAMPEQATVGLVYRTDDAKNAERLLHSTLRSRGRNITVAPGKEWFMTSLDEVRGILDFATGQP